MAMLVFKEYSESALIEQNTADQRKLKSYVERQLKLEGVKLTSSTRGGVQVRFALPIPEAEWQKYFKKFALEVREYPLQSISGKFFTYLLVTTKAVAGVAKGSSIAWVNNYSGKTSGGGQLFGNKELTPDALGLAGSTKNAPQIIAHVEKKLVAKYDKPIADALINILRLSQTKANVVKLDPALSLKSTDLAKVSSDFGEIMAAVWSMTALRFRQAYFPTASNEPLIDFYGIRLGVQYPVSVKSGGGGKVTTQNIVNAIKNRAKTAGTLDRSEEISLEVFRVVNDYSAKEQMIKLHQLMDTPGIKELAKVTGIAKKKLDLASIKDWVADKDMSMLKSKLIPFWEKNAYGKPTERVLEGQDKLRLIISPLGEAIWKVLNNDANLKKSLTDVARMVAIIQVNVDVKTKSVHFKSNYFREAEFEFGWPGYISGNKLGFKMSLKK